MDAFLRGDAYAVRHTDGLSALRVDGRGPDGDALPQERQLICQCGWRSRREMLAD
jgi:hypothetical protein